MILETFGRYTARGSDRWQRYSYRRCYGNNTTGRPETFSPGDSYGNRKIRHPNHETDQVKGTSKCLSPFMRGKINALGMVFFKREVVEPVFVGFEESVKLQTKAQARMGYTGGGYVFLAKDPYSKMAVYQSICYSGPGLRFQPGDQPHSD